MGGMLFTSLLIIILYLSHAYCMLLHRRQSAYRCTISNINHHRHHMKKTSISTPYVIPIGEDDHKDVVLDRRRRWIHNTLMKTFICTSSMLYIEPGNAARVRGAAELDMEYYLRDIFGTNNERMGNILPSPPPEMKLSRTIQSPLLDVLLKADLSYDDGSATIRALIDTILQGDKNIKVQPSQEQVVILQNQIQQSIQMYKQKVLDSFYKRASWNTSTLQDQYYFDMLSYTIWKTASILLPASYQRTMFNQQLGQYVYQSMIKQQLINIPNSTSDSNINSNLNTNNDHPLTYTNQYVTEILNVFTKYGFIASYQLGDSIPKNNDNNNNMVPLFDSYDDDVWVKNDKDVSIDVIVHIYEAATLGASLQINGESNRFIPDYIGPTLSYMWYQLLQESSRNKNNTSNSIRISYETYFLDSTYRPNPKDYFPNEQIYQFTLSKS